MIPAAIRRPIAGIARVVCGTTVIAILIYAYMLRIVAQDANPFDFFGYFTNQTSLIASVTLVTTGVLTLGGRDVPPALTMLRALATSYLLVVAVVYNLLVPGTGSAPAWVSAILHVLFPLVVLLDWVVIGDRQRLSWSRLWLLLPYPVLWLAVVLTRGATDGWVPYGFLLPEYGIASLLAHIVGLLATVIVAGALVWAASRLPGMHLNRVA